MNTLTRTIVSAMYPKRLRDSYTEIFLMVWFEELDEPVPFTASPFDCERHGKELWIRAMGGEYGEIEVLENAARVRLVEASEAPKLLEYRARSDAA